MNRRRIRRWLLAGCAVGVLAFAAVSWIVGYAALLVDLQAHGDSPGKNTTAGYRERLDAAAAVDRVRARFPGHRIGVLGCSLGGAAAVLASPLGIDALVLESVYPTIREAVRNRVSMRAGPLCHVITPVLLVQLRMRLGIRPAQLRPIDHIADAGCPVVVVAGDRDRRTALAESRRLFDAAAEPKRLLVFAGATHTDLLQYDPGKYREVVSFLDLYLKGGASRGGERP